MRIGNNLLQYVFSTSDFIIIPNNYQNYLYQNDYFILGGILRLLTSNLATLLEVELALLFIDLRLY